MKTTLVIMAAGIGSRYGGGIKQLATVGKNGEIIMDYAIYDALKAGFNKVVFVIRKDLEKDFKEIIGNRIASVCETDYVFQELDDIPVGFSVGERTKPWGTGQAILVCKDVVKEPFAVINADDFYGREAFVKLHDYLVTENDVAVEDICMAGYILKNTLSDNGSVTRGICLVDEDNVLMEIDETKDIIKVENGAAAKTDDGLKELNENAYVSMNMWGLKPSFFNRLERGFIEFLSAVEPGDIKSEYLLPIYIDTLIKKGVAKVTLLETKEKWFGMTYKEDLETVRESIAELVANGTYPEKLF
ncbi:MAG: nucleotidyltransferase [Clostridia bacterium]|nr:nucleotidyltransferase [Clostridia bacterium]